ncbi:aldo/keto reductase [Kitasatospora sp. NPDC059795]|uniref:aldo/keto reductase n=1 Tax=Kitasatospora sp. NPDC059795 TaxID=3346949 RepID=UPI0036682772
MRAADRRVVLGLHRSRHERRVLTAALNLGVTAIDTAFNYRGFTSHATLAGLGDDLLSRFTLSTKVGYFPGPGGTHHSLDPGDLRAALGQAVRDLGREPDVVLLHNPEASLGVGEQGPQQSTAACDVLAEAAKAGTCATWGISTWDPRALATLGAPLPSTPEVLMARSGLLVRHEVLAAAEFLAAEWGIGAERRWGMSPFGGSLADPPWRTSDPRLFLAGETTGVTKVQAALRVSFELPAVRAVAVGTDQPDHLRELADAAGLAIDTELVGR